MEKAVTDINTPNKRARARNYIEEEKENLLVIVQKHKQIIENKKTDAVSSQTKSNYWAQIAQEYNSLAKTGLRKGIQLKLLYENLKKTAKKHRADEKIETYVTGGGKKSLQVTHRDLQVLSFLGKRAEGITNPYDSNADFPSVWRETMNTNVSLQSSSIIVDDEVEKIKILPENQIDYNLIMDDDNASEEINLIVEDIDDNTLVALESAIIFDEASEDFNNPVRQPALALEPEVIVVQPAAITKTAAPTNTNDEQGSSTRSTRANFFLNINQKAKRASNSNEERRKEERHKEKMTILTQKQEYDVEMSRMACEMKRIEYISKLKEN